MVPVFQSLVPSLQVYLLQRMKTNRVTCKVGTADYAAVSEITSSSGLLTINGNVELGRIHPNPSKNRLAWAVSYHSISGTLFRYENFF